MIQEHSNEYLIVGFEARSGIKPNLLAKSEENGSKTVARLLGRDLARTPLIKDLHQIDLTHTLGEGVVAELFRTRRGNSGLVICLPIPSSRNQISDLTRTRWMASRLETLGISVETKYSVDAVVALVLKEGSPWANGSWPQEWIIEKASKQDAYFSRLITARLVAHITIERSVLNWACSYADLRFSRIFTTPYCAFLVRRHSVQLLMDRSSIRESYERVRIALNLHRVREDLLQVAASWWSTASFVIGLVALALAVLALRI